MSIERKNGRRDALKKQGEIDQRHRRGLSGSFTIEAALVVPLVLAVVFLLLQVIVYLHDTVSAETWLYQESWKQRWNEEQESQFFAEEEFSSMAVLRAPQIETMERGTLLQKEVTFEMHLLPEFVTILWEGMPRQTQKRSVEHIMSPGRFVRIVAAIREEWEETIKE